MRKKGYDLSLYFFKPDEASELINLITQVITNDDSLCYASLVEQAVTAVPNKFFTGYETLTVRIVDVEEAQELNGEFRGIFKPTNVLSFPTDDSEFSIPDHLGDILICAPLVISEAMVEQGNPADRLVHLTVHGVLHLVGFTHDNDFDGSEMELLEIQILSSLGIENPYHAEGSALANNVSNAATRT